MKYYNFLYQQRKKKKEKKKRPIRDKMEIENTNMRIIK